MMGSEHRFARKRALLQCAERMERSKNYAEFEAAKDEAYRLGAYLRNGDISLVGRASAAADLGPCEWGRATRPTSARQRHPQAPKANTRGRVFAERQECPPEVRQRVDRFTPPERAACRPRRRSGVRAVPTQLGPCCAAPGARQAVPRNGRHAFGLMAGRTPGQTHAPTLVFGQFGNLFRGPNPAMADTLIRCPDGDNFQSGPMTIVPGWESRWTLSVTGVPFSMQLEAPPGAPGTGEILLCEMKNENVSFRFGLPERWHFTYTQ